jgi:hypothetical protein
MSASDIAIDIFLFIVLVTAILNAWANVKEIKAEKRRENK